MDSNSVFTLDAKIPFNTFFQPPYSNYLTDGDNVQDLKSYLQELSISDQGALVELDNGYFLMLYPVRLKYNAQTPTAIVGFVLNQQAVTDRFTVVSGKLFDEVMLYYQGQPLIGDSIALPDDSAWSGNTVATNDYVAARSDSGVLILLDTVPAGGWYSDLNAYRAIVFAFLCLFMIILIASVILVLRKQYEPIRRMSEKVLSIFPQDILDLDNPNQLQQIEQAFDLIQQQNLLGKEQIKEQINLLHNQTATLKQQVLLLILKGNVSEYLSQQMEELNVHLTGSFFRVFSLSFKHRISEDTLQSIENLSDDEHHYYALQLRANLAIVICSFLLETNANEAKDLLEAIATSQSETSFTIFSGLTVTSFDKIPVSYYSIQAPDQCHDESKRDAAVPESSTSWYHNHSLLLMLNAIRDKNREAAFDQLDQLMDIVAQHYPSALIQRVIMADILSKLLQTSYEIGVPISPEEAGSLSIYTSLTNAHRDLKAILNRMFVKLDQQQAQYESDLSLQIKKYIDDHALEYNCSLNRVAEVFNLPPKQINHYIRLATDQTYKEYELTIRIKKAYELLTESSLSVMQISEAIGYMDVSSFIKAFKNITGITPGAYRKNAGKSE